jgi:hypothetical protein
MSLRDFAERFPVVGDTPGAGGGCTYVQISGAPESLLFMISDGRVARADARANDVQTSQGAHVGSTVTQLDALYPDLIVRPHKYLDEGNNLIVMPHAPADTMRWMLFETRADTVIHIRAGMLPEVRWVEGCA